MTIVPVTVLIPVGPYEVYKRWLGECLESVKAQTMQPSEFLIVDDMADIKFSELRPLWDRSVVCNREDFQGRRFLTEHKVDVATLWLAPWRIGDVGAFNCGVALAKNDLVFLLSCDDTLEPDCIEQCYAEWTANKQRDAYYWVANHYMDGQPDQALPFSAGMVTKGLWRETGGFPVEATGCGGDAALHSILLTYLPDRLVKVAGGRPLYNVRVHAESETAKAGPWLGIMGEVRGLLTKQWQSPKWGRMS